MVNTSDSFSSLWNGHESVPLFDEFSYVVLSAEDLQPAFTNFQQRMWSGYQECNIDLALTAAESAASSKLAARLESAFHLYLGIFAHDRLIGWSWGRQESAEEFHMIVTALLPSGGGAAYIPRSCLMSSPERRRKDSSPFIVGTTPIAPPCSFPS